MEPPDLLLTTREDGTVCLGIEPLADVYRRLDLRPVREHYLPNPGIPRLDPRGACLTGLLLVARLGSVQAVRDAVDFDHAATLAALAGVPVEGIAGLEAGFCGWQRTGFPLAADPVFQAGYALGQTAWAQVQAAA